MIEKFNMVILEPELSCLESLDELDKAIVARYQLETDEQLLQRIVKIADYLGRAPKKSEVVGSWYIKQRLGAWHRVLEQAGIRKVSQQRKQKIIKRQEKRKIRDFNKKKKEIK